MREIDIEVFPEESEEIERASYEVISRQGVIDRYLEKHKDDDDESAINAIPFKYFMSLLAQSEAELAMAKSMLEKKYVPESFVNHQYQWTLDYMTHIIHFVKMCDCEE